MTIYGGFYHEKCIFPEWDQIYGSAGRAAAILSNFTKDLTLNTFYNEKEYLDIFTNLYNINYTLNYTPFNIQFNYFHTFSRPEFFISKNLEMNKLSSIKIEDNSVICFGTIEANTPLIKSKYAIFDFQSSKFINLYNEKNEIENLAFIMNLEEAKYISKESSIEKIKDFFFSTISNLKVLVLKDGPFGGFLFNDEKLQLKIPIYKSNFIFKIGTGDIFTSIFGYFWINQKENKLSLEEILNYSSFATAFYSKNYKSQYKKNFLDTFRNNPYEKLFFNKLNFKNKVYLAGPFFNMSQRWQIEDTKKQLEKLNFDVFSPIHHVGIGESNDIAQKDLKGLDDCDSVFAILNGYDPGTVFEIGYAIAKGKKVVLFSEQKDNVNLTMFKGTDCLIFDDITTALYTLVWEMSLE